MDERGLAASTIDRRLSTACGFYRFAHIDGHISSNPAQYVRRPTVHPSEGRGLDRGELGGSSSAPSGSNTLTPARSVSGQDSGLVHPHMLQAAFIMAALDAGVPLREVQVAARDAHLLGTSVSVISGSG